MNCSSSGEKTVDVTNLWTKHYINFLISNDIHYGICSQGWSLQVYSFFFQVSAVLILLRQNSYCWKLSDDSSFFEKTKQHSTDQQLWPFWNKLLDLMFSILKRSSQFPPVSVHPYHVSRWRKFWKFNFVNYFFFFRRVLQIPFCPNFYARRIVFEDSDQQTKCKKIIWKNFRGKVVS